MTAQIVGMTEKQYNAAPGLRATALKDAYEDPGLYYGRWVAKDPSTGLPLFPVKQSNAMLLGSVVDCLVFEPDDFPNRFALRPENALGTAKKGTPERDAYDAFKRDTLTKISLENFKDAQAFKAQYQAMVASVQSDPDIAEMIRCAVKQQTILWESNGFDCKMRSDLFLERPLHERDIRLDLKTSRNPYPENWLRGGLFSPISEFHYDLQGAHYEDATRAVTGRPCEFHLIVVGSSYPYPVFIYDITAALPMGEVARQRAFASIKRGMIENVWRHPESRKIHKWKPSKWDFPQQEESEE